MVAITVEKMDPREVAAHHMVVPIQVATVHFEVLLERIPLNRRLEVKENVAYAQKKVMRIKYY